MNRSHVLRSGTCHLITKLALILVLRFWYFSLFFCRLVKKGSTDPRFLFTSVVPLEAEDSVESSTVAVYIDFV